MPSTPVILGNPLPLSLALSDGASGLYPQAVVYDSSDTPVTGSPFDLAEVGSTGRYTSAAFTPATEETFIALFITYTDAGHTIESATHGRIQEMFTVSSIVSDVTSILEDTEVMEPRIDQSISVTEGNIRGADSEDLTTIKDILGFGDGAVWINGETGNDANPGTVTEPVLTIAQAKTVADANDIRRIKIVGDFYEVLSGPLIRYQILSDDWFGIVFIDINGQDVYTTSFINCFVTGTIGGAIPSVGFRDAFMWGPMSNLGASFYDCYFFQYAGSDFDLVPTYAGGATTFIRCGNAAAGGGSYVPTTFGVSGRTHVEFAGWYGTMRLKGLNNAASVINVDCFSGQVEILSTCILGTVIVRGSCNLIDNSAPGCTVIDQRTAQEVNVEGHVTGALTAYDTPTQALIDTALIALTALVKIGNAWSKDNVVWEDQVYDHTYQGRKFMTAADGWAYDSKANADTHDKSTGLLYTVHLSATYTNDECTNMTVTRDP